jgi:hypothetical protein
MKAPNIRTGTIVRRVFYDVVLIIIGFLLFTAADGIRSYSIEKKTDRLINEMIRIELLEMRLSMTQARKMIADEVKEGTDPSFIRTPVFLQFESYQDAKRLGYVNYQWSQWSKDKSQKLMLIEMTIRQYNQLISSRLNYYPNIFNRKDQTLLLYDKSITGVLNDLDDKINSYLTSELK